MSSTELILKCRQNDPKAQMQLYKKYCGGMYNVARRYVNDADDAEDMLQEAFIRAFEKIDQYSGKVSFGAWLKKIVVHQCLDFIRKKTWQRVTYEDNLLHKEEEEDWTVDGGLNIDEIKGAIGELKENNRYVVLLFLVEGYNHKEIAEILDISETTSRTRLKRGKTELKNKLKSLRYETRS